jgi:hypothetical protein
MKPRPDYVKLNIDAAFDMTRVPGVQVQSSETIIGALLHVAITPFYM